LFGWEGEWERRVGQARDAELMRLDSESTSWAIMSEYNEAVLNIEVVNVPDCYVGV